MGYIPFRISTLRAEHPIPFGVHILFKEQYILYNEAGKGLAKETLLKLKQQRIAKFYILDSQEREYQDYLDQLLNNTLSDPNVSTEDKAAVIEGATTTAVENAMANPHSQKCYNSVAKMAQKIREFIINDPQALGSLFGETSHDGMLLAHSLNVCALSITLGKMLGLEQKQLDDLSIAALLHDIGHKQLESSFELFTKSKTEFDLKDKKSYAQHVLIAQDLLQDKAYIDEDILRLIQRHEENLYGEGPLKLKKLELDEEILSIVNAYDKKIMTLNLSRGDAIKQFMIDEVGKYNLKLLTQFRKMLKLSNLI